MRYFIFAFAISALAASPSFSQNSFETGKGNLSLGVRNTFSFFGSEHDSPGLGIGGHFRLQFSDRINSEWFADFIKSNIEGLAFRKDYHIGWSVQYYPVGKTVEQATLFKPFIMAGHCFDYSRFSEIGNPDVSVDKGWSSAVQAGVGTHLNLSPRFDISLEAQYMIHLGKDIHADIHGDEIEFEVGDHSSLEGHLLITLSVNYKIADLW